MWNRFYDRLLQYAKKKFGESPRRVSDEEDVVACAFETLFRRVRLGQFPRLHDRDDLWHLLLRIRGQVVSPSGRTSMLRVRPWMRVSTGTPVLSLGAIRWAISRAPAWKQHSQSSTPGMTGFPG